jgi:hypothetical protein
MLIAGSTESNPVYCGHTLVNLGHHLKNLVNNPNDPLNEVNTPYWSKLGQNPGQTPLPLSILRNFCRVLQISPKHSKINQY